MQHFARQDDGAALVDVGIGQIHRQDDIVLLNRAGQQQRPLAVQQQLHTGEIAGVIVEQAARRQARIDAVAQGIEHREAVTLLEGARPALLDRFCRLNIKSRNIVRRVREGLGLHSVLAYGIYSAAIVVASSVAASSW